MRRAVRVKVHGVLPQYLERGFKSWRICADACGFWCACMGHLCRRRKRGYQCVDLCSHGWNALCQAKSGDRVFAQSVGRCSPAADAQAQLIQEALVLTVKLRNNRIK